MDASEDTTPATDTRAVPYVGMRPFDRAEHDWFYGRDADAQFLVDKVLSARLTLLYAPSGVGKSSLLRARVIPSLEDEDCRVLYFDAWAGVEPESALKHKLAAMAVSAGIADPLVGAPTLTELARLIASDGKTPVLLLDQFEEFLINHPQGLDPLRKELAALVRTPSVDARVLISLREEFLAAIEPFRPEILTLFQSTYRLESLSDEKVRDAVVKPAARFGGDVEPALVDRLIADLSEGATDGATDHAAPADAAPARGWQGWIAPVLDRLRPHEATSNARRPRLTGDPIQRVSGGAIDLPMLQLVCESLWDAAPAIDGRKALTLDFYQTTLGGKRKILGDHIRSRMPRPWRDRFFTATLMRYLAPPSGLKISYSPADLAAYSGLDSARVEAELDRLSSPKARILRQREFKDSVRYELQHDALIRHITPWRDEVLAEAAARRRLQWAGAGVAVVVTLVGVQRLDDWREVRQNTSNQLRDLSAMSGAERERRAATTFESVARYVLFQESGSGRFDDLKNVLVANQGLLPDSYPDGAAGLDVLPPLGSTKSALTMRYSTDRRLDVQSFSRAWSEVAQEINGSWGIPVPKRLHLQSDGDIPRRAIQVESGGKTLLSFDVEAHEDMGIVFVKDAPESALEFHGQFEQEWRRLPELRATARGSGSNAGADDGDGDDAKDGTWWAVPRWSLPVWRAAGLRVWPGSAYPALAIHARVQSDPTMLLTPPAAEFLVQRVAQEYPCTAAEVLKHRGLRLSEDLVAWMRGADGKARPLLHPHLLFDALADPGVQEAAKKGASSSTGYLAAVSEEDAASWPQSTGTDPLCQLPPELGSGSQTYNATFREIEGWLPPLAPKVRVALGAALVRAWTNEPETIVEAVAAPSDQPGATTEQINSPGKTTAWTSVSRPQSATAGQAVAQDIRVGISREVEEAVERLREDVYKRSGMRLPQVTFQDASSELSGDRGRHFRVLVFDDPDDHGTSVDAGSADRHGIDQLIAALDSAVSPALSALVDAESVQSILVNNPRTEGVRKEQGLSATDLKRLLRAVIGVRSPGTKTVQSAADRTVSESDWLISSLVFWKAYYTHEKAPTVSKIVPDLADRMRRLQARRQARGSAPAPGAASDLIQRGIAALEAGRVANAETLFDQALSTGPRATVETMFVDRYAARWRARRHARAVAACPMPLEGTLDLGLRSDVAALLDEPESGRDRNTSRDLALCLLSSMPPTMPQAKAALRLKIAGEYGAAESWPLAQGRWLALQLLEQYDPLGDPPATLERGAHFVNAALRRLPARERNDTFNEVRAICVKPGMKNWCWSLLAEVAEAYPDPWMTLDFALALSDRESDARRAATWAERAEKLLPSPRVSNENRPRFDFWATYIKAHAEWLGSSGDRAKHKKAQDSILALIESPMVTEDAALNATAHATAINLMLGGATTDREKVSALIESGLTIAGHEPEFMAVQVFSGLRYGDTAAVKSAVDQAAAKAAADEAAADRGSLLFVAAVGGLMIGHERAEWAARQFIRTGDPYALLVLMLLRAGTGVDRDDASRLLEDRWRRVDRATWDRRLQGGDGQVWYEMLLGYSLDKVPASDIFEPVRDDAAFAASKLAHVPFTRRAMHTEAYFYDAVRWKAKGDRARELASLKQVVAFGGKTYIEYDLAQHLLREGSKR